MNILIYLIAFLEGFTTLSVEIVALRKFTPIVGTNSVSTSIVLGVVLLALSYGYYIGGKISGKNIDIKKRLVFNLIIASIYYFIISFQFSELLLESFLYSTGSYFFSVLVTSILLFAIPVFLASQTIPLLSVLIKGNKYSENIGKLLFYSTVGSFLGAVLTSSLFFPLIGVDFTAVISSIFLLLCSLLISKYFIKSLNLVLINIAIIFVLIGSSVFLYFSDSSSIFKIANSYHNIEVYEIQDKRIFSQNGAFSSGIILHSGESFFSYIIEVKDRVLELEPKNVLIIGAAGFTLPNEISEFDFVENIDVVDVDPSLKNIAEEYFLEKELSSKINFIPEPSRYFLNKVENKKYDLVLVDVYTGKSLPPQILTKEFFQSLNDSSKAIYLNLILDSNLDSDFSKRLFSTIDSAFPLYYKIMDQGLSKINNFVVSNTQTSGYIEPKKTDSVIYTDNLNSIEIDIFKMKEK